MKISTNTRVFLAVLALVFALQALFDGHSAFDAVPSEAVKIFVVRLGISALIAVAVAFFWGLFHRNR